MLIGDRPKSPNSRDYDRGGHEGHGADDRTSSTTPGWACWGDRIPSVAEGGDRLTTVMGNHNHQNQISLVIDRYTLTL
jgi:hypothetical protein